MDAVVVFRLMNELAQYKNKSERKYGGNCINNITILQINCIRMNFPLSTVIFHNFNEQQLYLLHEANDEKGFSVQITQPNVAQAPSQTIKYSTSSSYNNNNNEKH